jgi:4-amino-4-deoxy-L-arabinose transferase-like glycosyltransferase
MRMKLPDFRSLKDKPAFWLVLLFVLVLGIRLYLAFQTEFFNYDAYFNLRQAEYIHDNGLPLYKDDLSYGGKTQLFAPLNHYILAAFSFIMPLETAAKIIPNLFAAMLIFVVYLIAFRISKSSPVSFATALMSGLIPVYFVDLNRVSVNYLALLLVFTIIYCMLRLNERKYVDYTLILMFLLVLTTPMAFVLVIGLLLYLLLLRLENMPIEMKELELILFLTFLVFWVNLLIYKNAFLAHGFLVIWQNIPIQVLSNFFSTLGFIQLFWAVSIVPLILGIYAFYAVFHHEQSKDLLLVMALGLSTFLLLWFKLLDLISGLIFLSIIFVIMTAYSLKRLNEFISKSKIHKYQILINISLILLFMVSLIPSSIAIVNSSKLGPMATPTVADVEALQWARSNTPNSTIIMSGLDEGNMVTYYANRKNVMDTNFLLTPRIDQRLSDLNEVYTTTFETNAIGILTKYNSKYILVSSHTLNYYGVSKMSYLMDDKCFDLVYYREGTYLYKNNCKIA